MRAVGRESMDDGVAVAVGDVDLAVRRDRNTGRVVEGRLKLRRMPRADGAGRLAAGAEDEDLVGIAVHEQDAAVGRDGQAVRIGDAVLAPGRMHATVRAEDHHRRLGALVGIHQPGRVHRDGADEPERRPARVLPPRTFHAITSIAHDDDEIAVEGHRASRVCRSRAESDGTRPSHAGPRPPPAAPGSPLTGPRPPVPTLRSFDTGPGPPATSRCLVTTPCAPRPSRRCGTAPPARRRPGR